MMVQLSVSRELWQRLAQQCPWATFFHTPAWAETIAATFPGFRVAAIAFVDDAGSPVILPAVAQTKQRLLRTRIEYKSMEPGVYGGFLAEQPLSRARIQAIAAALCSLKKSSGRIIETPGMPLNLPEPFVAKPLTTHLIPLGRPYAEVAAGFSRGQKSNINQALHKAVQVRQAQTEQDIEQYYVLYRETLSRWGSARGQVYPIEFFMRLYGQRDQGVQFRLAEAEDTINAGIVVLAWQRTLVYWHGSSRQDYFKFYPNNVLHAKVLEWACAHGFSCYDMGPSMGLTGVERFKQSFGAQEHRMTAYRWKT